MSDIEATLAELDRLRALIAAVLAECSRLDNEHAALPYNTFETYRIGTDEVRRLLGAPPVRWNEDGSALLVEEDTT